MITKLGSLKKSNKKFTSARGKRLMIKSKENQANSKHFDSNKGDCHYEKDVKLKCSDRRKARHHGKIPVSRLEI